MNRQRYFYPLVLLILVASGCIKEDHFGKSTLKQILYFTLKGQVGNSNIKEDSLKIYITLAASANLQTNSPDSVGLSTFAKISPAKTVNRDFSTPVKYAVTAEDGSTSEYTIIVVQEGANPQLENSDFDDWYTPAGLNYQEPGKDANTIWASANAGVATMGLSNVNTTALLINGTDFAAHLVTKDLGSLAQITGQRMGSATLFTGKFVLNIANPIASAQFGILYTSKPKSFTVDMKYQPGTPYKDGRNNVLNKTDSCDIYLLLENRDNPGNVKRIATGWYRSSIASTNYQTLSVPLVYGQLPAGSPDYQKPPNGLYGLATDRVTHISVVFASSAQGLFYEGAVNSVLDINHFKLNY
ncbi:MAG: hypothetical protein RLZZ28_2727 [Bacteroidota bacterium]|jgi:hypothetical protein